jgi:hypothetical protein
MKREKMLYYIIMNCRGLNKESVKMLLNSYPITMEGDRTIEIYDTTYSTDTVRGERLKMEIPLGRVRITRQKEMDRVRDGTTYLKLGFLYKITTEKNISGKSHRYMYDFYIGRLSRFDDRENNEGLILDVCYRVYQNREGIEKKDVCLQKDYINGGYRETNFRIPFGNNCESDNVTCIRSIEELKPIVSPELLRQGQLSNRRKSIYRSRNQSLQEISRKLLLENSEIVKQLQGTPYYSILLQNYTEGKINQHKTFTKRRRPILNKTKSLTIGQSQTNRQRNTRSV